MSQKKITKLAQLLIDRGMHQTDLVAKMKESGAEKITHSYISKLVTGKKKIAKVSMLLQLSRVLNVNPNELIDSDYYAEIKPIRLENH